MACPNCGGELVARLELPGEVVVEPTGGVKVCSNCYQATDAEAEAVPEPSDESNVLAVGPRAEDLPREPGEPVPPPPPTDVLAEDPQADAEPAPEPAPAPEPEPAPEPDEES